MQVASLNPEGEAADTPRLEKPGFVEEALPWLDAVFRFSLRLSAGNAAEAEDIVQETFLRAYRHWDSYQPGTSARSWLFTIARNVFLRTRERQARRPESNASDIDFNAEALAAVSVFEDAKSADPERRFFDSFIDAEVTAAIERLPEEFRSAVVLSDVEGLNYAEIAAVLGIPIGTVKSRLYRGRRLLERALLDYAREMGYVKGSAE